MSTIQINHVCLGGNLTREPVLSRRPAGTICVEFGISIKNSYTTRDGEKVERICYVEIIAWGRLAEMVAAHVHQGSGVVVDGELLFESWMTSEGESRSRLRVSATSIYFMGEKASLREEMASPEPRRTDFTMAGGR